MSIERMIHDDHVTVWAGDCLDVLRDMPAASVDAVVTDPPYGLANTTGAKVAETVTAWVSGDREYIPAGSGFMGRRWDAFVPPVAVWDECLRVLKPGGHLVAFAGSRTLDLMTLGVRLAGFDVRDTLAWLYGGGFPKGGNMDEAMRLHAAGVAPGVVIPPEVYEVTAYLRAARDAAGWTNRRIDEVFGTNGMAGHWTTSKSQPRVPSLREWARLKEILAPHLGDDVDPLVERFAATNRPEGWRERGEDVVFLGTLGAKHERGAPPEWSTALKPGYEPIVLARKPVEGSTFRTVQAHGTGALHVGACRVGTGTVPGRAVPCLGVNADGGTGMGCGTGRTGEVSAAVQGRWPANVLLDEEAAAALDDRVGELTSGKMSPTVTTTGRDVYGANRAGGWTTMETYGDTGGPSRFFYTSKASGRDRVKVGGKGHPTVKPLDLMQWLVRLVTPPGGIVLDPFAGSGTTLEAAIHEGFRAIGVEREPDYQAIIRARLERPIERALDLGGLL